MDRRRVQKERSPLSLFLEADKSFKKSVDTLLNFANSTPALPRENRLAIISALFAPQWVKKVTYNEIRIALVRACWEKMCDNPNNNIAIRHTINDLAEFAFYAQKHNNIEMLSKMGAICYGLTKENPIYEPRQAQVLLRTSSWGPNKAIALVLAKPGAWKKMSAPKKSKDGFLHHLTEHKRLLW